MTHRIFVVCGLLGLLTVSSWAEDTASVYFYRYKQFTGSALTPSVYCDDAQLTRMENGKYFVTKLASGHHTFRSNDKQSGVDLDLKPGEEYYLRVELVPGMMKGHGRVVLVQKEQGGFEIKKLKEMDADKIHSPK